MTKGSACTGAGRLRNPQGPVRAGSCHHPWGWRNKQRTWCFQWKLVGAAAVEGPPGRSCALTRAQSAPALQRVGSEREHPHLLPLPLISSGTSHWPDPTRHQRRRGAAPQGGHRAEQRMDPGGKVMPQMKVTAPLIMGSFIHSFFQQTSIRQLLGAKHCPHYQGYLRKRKDTSPLFQGIYVLLDKLNNKEIINCRT